MIRFFLSTFQNKQIMQLFNNTQNKRTATIYDASI